MPFAGGREGGNWQGSGELAGRPTFGRHPSRPAGVIAGGNAIAYLFDGIEFYPLTLDSSRPSTSRGDFSHSDYIVDSI